MLKDCDSLRVYCVDFVFSAYWLFHIYSETLFMCNIPTVLSSLSMIIRESMGLVRRIRVDNHTHTHIKKGRFKFIQCDIIIAEPRKEEEKTPRTSYNSIAALCSVCCLHHTLICIFSDIIDCRCLEYALQICRRKGTRQQLSTTTKISQNSVNMHSEMLRLCSSTATHCDWIYEQENKNKQRRLNQLYLHN